MRPWSAAARRRSVAPNDLDELLYPPPALPHQPGRVRDYEMRATEREIEIAPGVFFPAWTYNGTVPGPIIRATEDDILRVHFVNAASHPHSIHFHGIHPANMDGVFEVVQSGESSSTSSRRSRRGCTSTTATRRR
jgi:FtsP/CotA-like multicopper oxidase with cupredoxin domain